MSDTINAISRALSADITSLNTISHNVANLNTAGYRAERSMANFATHLGDGTASSTQYFDLSEGALRDTGRSLDIALTGAGFFQVQRGNEVVLSRAGQLRLNEHKQLVTVHGDLVLVNSAPLQLESESVTINSKGELSQDGKSLGVLSMVGIEDAQKLIALDSGVFRYSGNTKAWEGRIQQGALEQSNVDAADETIRLMELTRHVESMQRALSIYDQAVGIGISKIGEN
jgi:flagellar basal-body rod protein FlgF